MNILYLNGDFFDQLAQYIFLRCCEVIDKEEIFIDDTYFYSDFGYDDIELLKVFPNLKLKMLKDNYSADEWDSMVSKCLQSSSQIQIPNILEEKEGLEFRVVANEGFYDFHPTIGADGKSSVEFTEKYEFNQPTIKLTTNLIVNNWKKAKPFKDKETGYVYPNIYYLGKWKHKNFAITVRQQLKQELEFKPFNNEENIKHMETILSKNGSIGIHINSKVFTSFESTRIINSYSDAIKKFRREVVKSNGTPAFFFFCDDIYDCEEAISQFNINPSDEIFYIQINLKSSSDASSNELSFDFDFGFDDEDNEDSYFDLQIMTYCDYLISQSDDYEPLLAGCISPKIKQYMGLGKEQQPVKKPVHKPTRKRKKK